MIVMCRSLCALSGWPGMPGIKCEYPCLPSSLAGRPHISSDSLLVSMMQSPVG